MSSSTPKAVLSRSVIVDTTAQSERVLKCFLPSNGQYCSLYLNAEPLPSERVHPLMASASSGTGDEKHATAGSAPADGSKVNAKADSSSKWSRPGLFRFTFMVQTLDKQHTLGTKEAHDHAFSDATSNWGWAQFTKRDLVYFNNATVKQQDGFLITVSIQAAREKPKIEKPTSLAVPPALIEAFGSLLDDPDHSDVVFVLDNGSARLSTSTAARASTRNRCPRQIFAIKKILAARSDYFRDMFEGGFVEGELDNDENIDDSGADTQPSHDGHHPTDLSNIGINRPGSAFAAASAVSTDDETGSDSQELEHAPLLYDSDAEIDEDELMADAEEGFEIDSDEHGPSAHHLNPSLNDDAEMQVQDGGQNGLLSKPSNRRRQSETLQSNDDSSAQQVATRDMVPSTSLRRSASSMAAAAARRNSRRRQVDAGGSMSDLPAPGRGGQRKRRRVVIRDSSYATFKALLFFLYTDTVEFAPLTSTFFEPEVVSGRKTTAMERTKADLAGVQKTALSDSDFSGQMLHAHRRRQEIIHSYCARYPHRPSPCSAKAMYRLADKLHLPDLKKRAEEHISNSLTVHNIVWEAFSSFASFYPEVRGMELKFLLKHWDHVKETGAMKTIFARRHAHPGLAEVWPHLLTQLEYRPKAGDSDEGPADANNAVPT